MLTTEFSLKLTKMISK